MIIGISGRIGAGKDVVGNMIQYLTWLGPAPSDDMPCWEEWQEMVDPKSSGWEIKKYAYKLKQIVSILTGATMEQLESQEFKSKEMSPEWWYWKLSWTRSDDGPGFTTFRNREDAISFIEMNYEDSVEDVLDSKSNKLEFIKPTYRRFLQEMGTDIIRDRVHRDAWVNALFSDYHDADYRGITAGEYSDPVAPKWIITDVRFPNELEAIRERGGIILRINRESSSSEKLHISETLLDNHHFDYVIDNDDTIEELLDKVYSFLSRHKLL
jgi:hypothetical protein